MRKFLVIVFCTALLFGCSSSGRIAKKQPDNIIKMMKEEFSFILVVSKKDCTSCASYKETLNQLVKNYKITIYNVIIEDYQDENFQNLLNNYLYSLINVPATFVVINGKVNDRYEGIIEYDTLVSWLKEYGAIN